MRAYETLATALPEARLHRYKRAYRRVVKRVRALLIFDGEYVRPTRSRGAQPFAQRGMPEVRRDKFDDGVILDKAAFAERARSRPPPLVGADEAASKALPHDLTAAIDYVVQLGSGVREERTGRGVAEGSREHWS